MSQINEIQGSFILYGVSRVGKTYISSMIEAEFIDCIQMGTLVSSLDQIDLLLEYLQLRINLVLEDPSPCKLVIFDNVQAIAPKEEENLGLVNIVKSERVS